MTNCSGRSYQKLDLEAGVMSVDLSQVLQALIEDRQARERNLAEERERREEERQARERNLAEERERREEERERREEETKKHMELLLKLVEGVQGNKGGGLESHSMCETEKEARVTKLTEDDDDDIEAYLTTFERMMDAYEVPQSRWSFKLAPQLIGRAQQAYAGLTPNDAKDYKKLKVAILKRYGVNEENYRQRFRQGRRKKGELCAEFAVRLGDLMDKWMQGCDNMEAVKDKLVMEQLIEILLSCVRIWVKEHKPKTSKEAGEYADDYFQARGPGLDSSKGCSTSYTTSTTHSPPYY